MAHIIGPFNWRRTTLPFRIYVRCRAAATFQPERRARFREMLHDLVAGHLELTLQKAGNISLTVTTVKSAHASRHLRRFFGRKDAWPNDLVMMWRVELPHRHEFWLNPPPPDGELQPSLEVIEEMHGASALVKLIQDIFFAMNITAPGAAQLLDGSVVSGREIIERIPRQMPDYFDLAADTATKTGWPTLTHIDLPTTWDWLMRQPGFVDGFGGGETGRALNALSHTLTAPSRPVALFWCMVAIESLFTSGEQGLTQQVRERTQLLLGHSKRAAKALSAMYSVRSKFVHGKLDLDGAHTVHDPADDPDVDRAADLAFAILIATLQTLIKRNWSGLRFDTTMTGVEFSSLLSSA
jgi:hypothetical protein